MRVVPDRRTDQPRSTIDQPISRAAWLSQATRREIVANRASLAHAFGFFTSLTDHSPLDDQPSDRGFIWATTDRRSVLRFATDLVNGHRALVVVVLRAPDPPSTWEKHPQMTVPEPPPSDWRSALAGPSHLTASTDDTAANGTA